MDKLLFLLWVTATLKLAAAAAATPPSVNVAVVVAAAAATVPTNPANSSSYFCNGGHPYMSSICPYQRRIQARGGFTVGRVSGVMQAFSVFAVANKAKSVQLATQLPRGDFGNYSAIIVTTPRTSGDALTVWAPGNAGVGASRGMSNNTGPCAILNIGIADTAQFTNINTSTQWFPQSFGALVPNAFGVDVSKLAQALYADEKLQTGIPLTYSVLMGSSSSSQAIANDIVNSVAQSGSGIVWFGANFVWPDRAVFNGTLQSADDWNTVISTWAQGLAELPNKPDIVFVGGLQAEVNVSRAILYGWMTAKKPWRPKVTLFAGGAVPPNPDELFVDTLFARQWSRSMRGIERDVKDVQGAAEPWISDAALDIQAPEVFARDIDPLTAVPASLRTDPLGPAIGGLTLVWLQKAIQVGCRDISAIEECDGRKISDGLRSITAAPSFFGPISSVNGQIAALSFFLSQFSDDLTQTYLSPSGSSNGTLHWSRSWDQLTTTLTTYFQPASYTLSGMVLFLGATSAVSQYVWVILAKRRSRRYRDVVTTMTGAILNTDGVLFCGQILLISSLSFGNLAPGQTLTGFRSVNIGLSAVLCTLGAIVTVRGLYQVVGSSDARNVDDNQSIGTASSAVGISTSMVKTSTSVSINAGVSVAPTSSTTAVQRALSLWLRMAAITWPLVACATASAVLLVHSVDAAAVPSINIGAVVGSFVLAWWFAATAPACMFIKSLGEWRAVLGGLCLMISKWVPASIIVATTRWSRYVVPRASLPASDIDGNTLFDIGCVMFMAVLAMAQFVMRVFYKGEAAQLESYVLDARKNESDAKQSLLMHTRDFHHAVLISNVGMHSKGPKPYHGIFSEKLLDDPAEASTLTNEAKQLQLETVVSSQAALLYFLNSATPPDNREGVEFLLAASMLVTYIGNHDDEPNDRKAKRRAFKSEIQELVDNMRRYFFESNSVNLAGALNQQVLQATDPKRYETSDDPVNEMIKRLSDILPAVKYEAMKQVRANQWSRIRPWHKNYAAFLCGLTNPHKIETPMSPLLLEQQQQKQQESDSASSSPARFMMTRSLAHLAVPDAGTVAASSTTAAAVATRRRQAAVSMTTARGGGGGRGSGTIDFHAIPAHAVMSASATGSARHYRQPSDSKGGDGLTGAMKAAAATVGTRSPLQERSPDANPRELPGTVPELPQTPQDTTAAAAVAGAAGAAAASDTSIQPQLQMMPMMMANASQVPEATRIAAGDNH